MGAPGYDVDFATWAKAGQGMGGAADTLASAVDTLCHELAGAGAPWGQDDIGRAFFNGSDGAPGFGTVRDTVLAGSADMVNLLRATGDTLMINGRNYRLAEDASTVGAAIPEGADNGALARQDPYRLPPVTESLTHSDPPPPVVQQVWGFVGTLLGGVEWPDGDMDALGRVKNSFTTVATVLVGVAQDVEGHARTVTANNAGETVEKFATFAAALQGGGEELGLLWLAGKCRQLADAVDFLMKQKNAARLQIELSCGFLLLTWALAWAISWLTGGSSIATAEAITEAEGFVLRTFLVTVAKAVAKAAGAGLWFAGGMDALGQYARIREGVQDGFDGGELAHALEEGAIAGAVMGGVGGTVAGLNTRFTTALADLMGSSGLARAGFAGVTGTLGNLAAQGLVEQKLDVGQAAAFGFGMAGLGLAGDVGKHILGQTSPLAEGAHRTKSDVPVDLSHYSDEGTSLDGRPTLESSSNEPVTTQGEAPGGTTMAGFDVPADDGPTHMDVPDAGQNRIHDVLYADQETGTDSGGEVVNSFTGQVTGAHYVIDGDFNGTVNLAGGGVEFKTAGGAEPALGQGPDGTTLVGGQGVNPPAGGSGTSGTAAPGQAGSAGLAGSTGGTPAAPAPNGTAGPPAPDAGVTGVHLDQAGFGSDVSRPDGGGAPQGGPVLRGAEPGDGGRPDAPRFHPGRTEAGPREVQEFRSADLNPDTRPPLIPVRGEGALTGLRGEHAYTLAEGDALHASQWSRLREDATATPVGRVHHPFENASKVEVRRLGVIAPDGGEHTVTEFTVRVRYHAEPGMTPQEVVRAQSNVLDAVDVHYNHQHRLADRSQVHVRVEFERAESADGAVRLRPGDGMDAGERPDMLTWYADMDPVTVAHEVGHHLDLHDEYADPQRPGAETLTAPGVSREPNLMGDALRTWADHTLIVDHNGQPVPSAAGLRDRHLSALQQLADRAPGAREAHGDAGPAVPAEHATRESGPLDLPDHVRDLLDRVGEDGRPVFPAEGRDALDHAVLLDRMHTLFGDEARTPAHLRYTEALTDAAHRLYETAPDYSFHESDLRGLRHLADVAGASPEGVHPHADLLHEVARETLGRNPAPREIEALTRLAEHLNDRMGGRVPFELSSDALHRAAADRLGTTRSPETTRQAIERLVADLPRDPGEHPVPRMSKYQDQKKNRLDTQRMVVNEAIQKYEQEYNGGRRLSARDRQALGDDIKEELTRQRGYVTSNEPRPKIWEAVRNKIFEEAPKGKNGEYLDAYSGQPIKPGDVNIGHKKGDEYRKLVKDASKLKLTKAQFSAAVNAHWLYQTEQGSGPGGNKSGANEDRSNNPSNLFKNAKMKNGVLYTEDGRKIEPNGTVIDVQTGKKLDKGEAPKKVIKELERAQQQAIKDAQQANQWLQETAQKANPNEKEVKALDAQVKANEAQKKADDAWFFKGSAQKEADKLQEKANKAREQAQKKGFFSW
ncbi:GH-E family nuclease [Actinoallomurus iriomotensis]|uniref:Toxin YqcG C-terminal domain-containing protein n=1 Tax=Actinoallomurus iriomotensis TaxID=478107 RepID=A0A9W6W5A8_9ACTN|nr:GH-E family nuclease [Actinoallomurus iriomotensis]GLY91299.1 hypothetical protein Airi02_092280 [Actinoallomurus iriomotensis]